MQPCLRGPAAFRKSGCEDDGRVTRREVEERNSIRPAVLLLRGASE